MRVEATMLPVTLELKEFTKTVEPGKKATVLSPPLEGKSLLASVMVNVTTVVNTVTLQWNAGERSSVHLV